MEIIKTQILKFSQKTHQKHHFLKPWAPHFWTKYDKTHTKNNRTFARLYHYFSPVLGVILIWLHRCSGVKLRFLRSEVLSMRFTASRHIFWPFVALSPLFLCLTGSLQRHISFSCLPFGALCGHLPPVPLVAPCITPCKWLLWGVYRLFTTFCAAACALVAAFAVIFLLW